MAIGRRGYRLRLRGHLINEAGLLKLLILGVLLAFPSIFTSACGTQLTESEQITKRGDQLAEQGRLDEAHAEYDRAAGVDSQPTLSRENSSPANSFDPGQYNAAIRSLDEAIRSNPQDATAYANRGFERMASSGLGRIPGLENRRYLRANT